jgi:hypothetical protein
MGRCWAARNRYASDARENTKGGWDYCAVKTQHAPASSQIRELGYNVMQEGTIQPRYGQERGDGIALNVQKCRREGRTASECLKGSWENWRLLSALTTTHADDRQAFSGRR